LRRSVDVGVVAGKGKVRRGVATVEVRVCKSVVLRAKTGVTAAEVVVEGVTAARYGKGLTEDPRDTSNVGSVRSDRVVLVDLVAWLFGDSCGAGAEAKVAFGAIAARYRVTADKGVVGGRSSRRCKALLPG
jgi:hypothetical protein